MKKTKSFISFLFAAVLVFSLLAPSALAAESKLIKDPVLEKFIKDELGIASDEVELSAKELEGLESLYADATFTENSPIIKDLSGLEYAKNLTYLGLYGHEFSDLTPISKLNKLDILVIESNPNIKSLEPISNLNNLDALNLSFNELDSNDIQPLSNLTNLKALILYDNNISEIDSLKGLKNLEGLSLSNNNLTSLEGLPTENLVYFEAVENKLTSLQGLSVKEDVYYMFYFNDNQITDISALEGITKGIVSLEDNKISDISPLKDMKEGRVNLYGNKLNLEAKEIIKELENRGVIVLVDESDFDPNAPAKPKPNKPAENTDNKRVSGASRYHTAVEISKKGWADGSADTVIIARGDSFPDALAGSTLAYEKNAPILLTGETLHQTTKDEIKRLGAKNAIVLGGEAAVSKKIVSELKGLGLKVDRVAGSGRYETAVDVAKELKGQADTAILAYGLNFPDALAIAPYAAEKGYPILLTEKDKLSKATKEYLAKNKNIKNIIIVGGEGVISKKVQDSLKGYNVERIAGLHRYDTAAKVAAKFGKSKKAYIANGNSFADALTGAVLAAKEGAPLLLVEADKLPFATKNAIKNIDKFTFLGGNAVITEKLKNQILK